MEYGDDSVYDQRSDECVHEQWQGEERGNCWKIPSGRIGVAQMHISNTETEGRQRQDYDANLKLVW